MGWDGMIILLGFVLPCLQVSMPLLCLLILQFHLCISRVSFFPTCPDRTLSWPSKQNICSVLSWPPVKSDGSVPSHPISAGIIPCPIPWFTPYQIWVCISSSVGYQHQHKCQHNIAQGTKCWFRCTHEINSAIFSGTLKEQCDPTFVERAGSIACRNSPCSKIACRLHNPQTSKEWHTRACIGCGTLVRNGVPSGTFVQLLLCLLK